MQCYGGPLDGFECDPPVLTSGRVAFGLIRRKGTVMDWPFWDGEPLTYKHTHRANYVEAGGKLLYEGLK